MSSAPAERVISVQPEKLAQRRIPFEFPDDIRPDWIPVQPELSAMLNGGSLTMPYLEPFLIRTMREAGQQIDDAALRADADGFNAQEGQHFRAHRRFNDLIKAKGYAELAEVEARMTQSYKRLDQQSLQKRMAYTAGFEAMTLGVTRWLIEQRTSLFKGADSRVASFVLWHMVEETEHKRVAFDVYQHLFGASLRSYWWRMIGVFHGSLDVMFNSMRAYKVILKKDGRWNNLRSRLRLAGHLWQFIAHVGPYLFRAALPGHDPRAEKDPKWVQDWLKAHARADANYVPLIDCNDPQMPIPFPPNAFQEQTA